MARDSRHRGSDRSYRAAIRRVHSASPYLSVDEIARRVGCHPSTVWRYLRRKAVIRMVRCAPTLTGPQLAARCDVSALFVQNYLSWIGRRDLVWGMAMSYERAKWAARDSRSPVALRRFVQHEDSHVREAAVRNPCSDRAVLVSAGRDTAAWVRRAVAADPRCPGWLLRELAADPDREVVNAVCQHPHLPVAVLMRFARRDAEPVYRRLAAGHPNSPAVLLAGLATDERLDIRIMVASNPNCPMRSLIRLALDPDVRVRAAANSNPNCPPELSDAVSRGSPLAGQRDSLARSLMPAAG